MSKHLFFEKDDTNVPKAILDSNGDVVLGLCKACGQGEGDLEDTCPMHGVEPFEKAMGRYNGQSYAETEIAELRAKLDEMQSTIDVLESHRPHWAQGYTDDGVAAQVSHAALSQLWKLLGVDNQTQAVLTLQKYAGDRYFVVEHIKLDDDGVVRICRTAARTWPEWAKSINPAWMAQ